MTLESLLALAVFHPGQPACLLLIGVEELADLIRQQGIGDQEDVERINEKSQARRKHNNVEGGVVDLGSHSAFGFEGKQK